MVKIFALSPFCPSKLRSSDFHTNFSPSSFLFHLPTCYPLPTDFYHSHLESYSSFHPSFSLCTVHSPHSVLPATLTHFGVLADCLRCVLYGYPCCTPSVGVSGMWDTGKVSTGVQSLVARAPWGTSMRILWLVKGLLFCPEEAP